MKDLYLKILDKFKNELPEFLWVDKDKGQLDRFDSRPALLYPACLIRFDIPNPPDDLGDKSQNVTMQIAFRMAFSYSNQTSGATPELSRENSLAYYDTIQKVFKTFQHWEDPSFNEWVRSGQVEEVRGDGLEVTSMIFNTQFRDTSALT